MFKFLAECHQCEHQCVPCICVWDSAQCEETKGVRGCVYGSVWMCVCVCACGSVRACVPTTYPHNASCSSHLHCARRRRVTGHDQARSVMRHACRGSVPASSSSRWNHVKFDIGVQCLGVYTCSVTIYDFSWYITCLHSLLPYSQK
jgi:hypothetical protein